MHYSRQLLTLTLLPLVLILAGCKEDSDTSEPETKEAQGAEQTVKTPEEEDREGQVLRHAVFFSFKDSSSAEDVDGVVNAFKALPEKIDAIVGFQYGTNNSPEGLHDGFTHCFLLTFENTAGRTEYIPHPAHAGDFADVLRPHMDKVFVIDYWGTPYESFESELKHCVFFKFKDDAAAEDVRRVENAFAELPGKIDVIRAFEWGTNNSPENHDHGFTHCFMVTFASAADRDTYIDHPDHQAFVEVLKPVLEKVRVLDFIDGDTTSQPPEKPAE